MFAPAFTVSPNIPFNTCHYSRSSISESNSFCSVIDSSLCLRTSSWIRSTLAIRSALPFFKAFTLLSWRLTRVVRFSFFFNIGASCERNKGLERLTNFAGSTQSVSWPPKRENVIAHNLSLILSAGKDLSATSIFSTHSQLWLSYLVLSGHYTLSKKEVFFRSSLSYLSKVDYKE